MYKFERKTIKVTNHLIKTCNSEKNKTVLFNQRFAYNAYRIVINRQNCISKSNRLKLFEE